MNISNHYWAFKSALTPKFCDEVIKYALSKEETMARTGGFGDKELTQEQVLNMQRKRKSDLVWLVRKKVELKKNSKEMFKLLKFKEKMTYH